MKHANISLFVPHVGCRHRCSFCDQNTITGESLLPHEKEVDEAVAVALESGKVDPKNTEIAFFGGSFTAIREDYMTELLDAAYKYVEAGTVSGIRISTRPDAIDENILNLLKRKGVKAIELGAQSMCDEVLEKNRRGHTKEDVKKASALIKEFGFELGLQMMTGLCGTTHETDIATAEEIIALKPDTVRIYPTIILEGTHLGELYKKGEYKTYSLSESVSLCAELLEKFRKNGIRVIRLGLHNIEQEKYLSGPWHPAFRELCEAEIYYNNALKILKTYPEGKYTLLVSPSAISKMTGQNKQNLARLFKSGYTCRVEGAKKIGEYEVKIKKEGER